MKHNRLCYISRNYYNQTIAQLAEERNVGIAVNSLTELTEVLKSVTPPTIRLSRQASDSWQKRLTTAKI